MSGYLLYKENTDIYTSWLCATAADHGSEVTTSRPIDPVEARAGKRPNGGKARERWRAQRDAAATAAAANNTEDGRPIYLVSSEEIMAQAEFLSMLDGNIIMPRPVWQAFKQALAGRKEYVARYATEELSEGDEEDGHVAFIRVLERSAKCIKNIAKVQQVASAIPLDINTTEVALSNFFDSLDLSDQETIVSEDTGNAEGNLTAIGEGESYQPKAVFRVQVDKASDVRFQRHCLLEQGKSDLAYLEEMWDKCDLGALDRGIAAFATQAIVALFEEKENELDEKASELRIHIVAELEPDWHNPLGLALICLRDIQAIRQVYPDYTFPLAFLQNRHTHIQDTQAIQDDYMLARFMMDLSAEMVCS
jgi:hypothetical protein